MNLIHRHIFANVALVCAAAVGMFALILMLGNAVKDLLGYMLAGQLALGTFFELTALLIPFVVSYALPMGMLTGILLVFGRMSSDNEITALRASGLSVAWLSAPILFIAILGVGLSILINFELCHWPALPIIGNWPERCSRIHSALLCRRHSSVISLGW